MSIGTLKPSKAELEHANEVKKKAKAIKRKVVKLKQGDSMEYRKLKEEVEKQKEKFNSKQKTKPQTRKALPGFMSQKWLFGRSVFLGKFDSREDAEKAKILAEKYKYKLGTNTQEFRDLIKSKL